MYVKEHLMATIGQAFAAQVEGERNGDGNKNKKIFPSLFIRVLAGKHKCSKIKQG